jgi:hypothetical protein
MTTEPCPTAFAAACATGLLFISQATVWSENAWQLTVSELDFK